MNQTEQPGINFDKFVLEKVHFKANPDFSFPKGGVPLDFSFETSKQIDKTKKLLKTYLDVTVIYKNIDNPPIDISVSVAGYFSIGEPVNIEVLEEFSEINAPAFLFPFAREIIANLTLKSGYPPMLIPPANIKALMGTQKTKVTKKKKKSKV